MATRIHDLGVVALGEAFRAGRVSVTAATDHYLDRIARFDPTLRAFTQVDAPAARAAAAESAARIEAGAGRPLDGLPVALKANIDVAGLAVHGGMGALRDRIASRDAAVVTRLRAAGAVILGLLNMEEAALGATTDNFFYGQCQNPHAIGHTPGGSSGGSGAAVAAGLCAAALGTDTLGSIRIPAAYCGVVGLKPGAGAVPTEGLLPLVERLDAIGPIARSVADAGAMFDAIADVPPAAPIERVATLSSLAAVEQQPAVAAAFRLAQQLLEGLGVPVAEHRVEIDHHRVRLAGFVEAAQAADRHFGEAATANPDGFSPALRSYMVFGRQVGADAVARGREAMDAAAAELRAVLGQAGAILMPTTPQAAFPHDDGAPVSQADFTALASIAGLPAISLPAGWTEAGLPVGVQLVGRAGGEAALLALARRLEAVLNAWRWPHGYA
jgi:aspartyl-tRNA(Asn)/glutamyl-tRNA(Gln) amidotransferase subunit A